MRVVVIHAGTVAVRNDATLVLLHVNRIRRNVLKTLKMPWLAALRS